MKPTKIIGALLLAGILAFVFFGWDAPKTAPHETVEGVAQIAQRLNIRNLVSAIYLGPRAADTFLEVMVVTLAVVGMRFAREEP